MNLDDRSVRDSERKAALMHFNTDQVTGQGTKRRNKFILLQTTSHKYAIQNGLVRPKIAL